jgi:hypothetical protein
MQQSLAYLVNCAAINQVEQQKHFRREREAEASLKSKSTSGEVKSLKACLLPMFRYLLTHSCRESVVMTQTARNVLWSCLIEVSALRWIALMTATWLPSALEASPIATLVP